MCKLCHRPAQQSGTLGCPVPAHLLEVARVKGTEEFSVARIRMRKARNQQKPPPLISGKVNSWRQPLGWFTRSHCQGRAVHQHWVIQGWHYLCHFLSTFCSHHHSAVMPSTVPLTFPEEGDDCKNQDSQEDARDEGQWHEQYFMAVDTQKIPSEFPVMTEGLKHQNSPNFMGCNTFIPSPMRSTGVYLHWASLGITHPVHRLGNSNQILNSQGVKYVIYNPSLAERRCSLRKLWVWSQEIKVQHLLINPASDFCGSEIICRGVGSGVDGGRDSGSSENGFWCNCNRKKKSQTCFKMCKFLQ